MSTVVEGKVILVGNLETFPSGFQKQNLVVETEDQYPQPISIEFFKDKTSLLDNIKLGDKVSVSYKLQGRKWESPTGDVKFFNTINGWRIEKKEQTVFQEAKQTKKKEENPFDDIEDSEPNLPF